MVSLKPSVFLSPRGHAESSRATCKSSCGPWQYGHCPLGQEGGAVKSPGLCRERAGEWSPGLDRSTVTTHRHEGREGLWLHAEARPWDQASERCLEWPLLCRARIEGTGVGGWGWVRCPGGQGGGQEPRFGSQHQLCDLRSHTSISQLIK